MMGDIYFVCEEHGSLFGEPFTRILGSSGTMDYSRGIMLNHIRKEFGGRPEEDFEYRVDDRPDDNAYAIAVNDIRYGCGHRFYIEYMRLDDEAVDISKLIDVE